jgi:hypothetical protein
VQRPEATIAELGEFLGVELSLEEELYDGNDKWIA